MVGVSALIRQRQRLALREVLSHAGAHVPSIPLTHMPEQLLKFLLLLLLLLPPFDELCKFCLGQPHVRVPRERVPGRKQSLEDVRYLLVSAVVGRRRGQQCLL